MTAVVGVYVHPKACPVCTDGQVSAREPGRPVGRLIPCPHCRGASALLDLVYGWDRGPWRGGAA